MYNKKKYRKKGATGPRKRLRTYKRKFHMKVPRNKLRINTGVGFPKTITMTHKYSQLYIASSSGPFNTFYYTCNGMYDPNISGAGHQPLYFDQMSLLYNHYCVIGSKMTVTFPQMSTNAIVGAFINDDTSITGSTSLESLMEQSQSRFRFIQTSSTQPTTLTLKWSAKKYFGRNPLANVDLQGTPSSNPNEQSFFTLYYGAVDKVSSISNFSANVLLEYIAVWKELKDVDPS